MSANSRSVAPQGIDAVAAWARWGAWLAALAAWTVALLTPQPVEVGRRVLPEGTLFPAAKVLHVGAYAFLAATAAWLRLARRGRWLLPAALVLHGAATEWLQTFVPPREGSLRDVALDGLGVAIGLALTWPWWRGPRQVTGPAAGNPVQPES
jgi:VanZ family protein